MQYYICLTCCQIPLLFSDNYYTLLYLSRLSIIYRESDLLVTSCHRSKHYPKSLVLDSE